MRILVTGAQGFIGRALIQRLMSHERFYVLGVDRPEVPPPPHGVEWQVVGDMNADTDWNRAVAGVHVIVHLAARVHVMRSTSPRPLEEYRRVNVAGTIRLARQAAAAGVRRLVFLSSVKVNGEEGVYVESDEPAPQDAYAVSKYEAEMGLRHIAGETGMEVVIIRPPLVYGPGVKANFQALMQAIRSGLPLPCGATHNLRSFVALENLVDFVITCAEHPAAANETFLVSDGEDLSTADLVRRLATAMGRPARLVLLPSSLLQGAAILCGKRSAAQRLLGSLRVDTSKARRVLGWVPPISVDEGLRRTAASV